MLDSQEEASNEQKESYWDRFKAAKADHAQSREAFLDFCRQHRLDPGHFVTPDRARSMSHHIQQLAGLQPGLSTYYDQPSIHRFTTAPPNVSKIGFGFPNSTHDVAFQEHVRHHHPHARFEDDWKGRGLVTVRNLDGRSQR